MRLRGYQLDLVGRVSARLRAQRKGILCLPTGAGKTLTSVHGMVLPAVARGWRVLWLVERQALVGQAQRDLERAGLSVDVLWARGKRHVGAQVTVAIVQSCEARKEFAAEVVRMVSDPRCIVVVDEVHAAVGHAALAGWMASSPAVWLGLTATPWAPGLAAFEFIEAGPSYRDLTLVPDPQVSEAYGVPHGAICPIAYYGVTGADGGVYDPKHMRAPDTVRAILDECARLERANHTLETARGLEVCRLSSTPRRVVFAADVAHAHAFLTAGEARGWRCAILTGSTGARERDKINAALVAGQLDLVASCDALSRGWDCPPVEVGIVCSPFTDSLAGYVQQVGRVARTCAPWKRMALVLDAAGCVQEWGRLIDLPVPTLEQAAAVATRHSLGLPPLYLCRQCGRCFEGDKCPECGWILTEEARIADAGIARVSAEEIRETRRKLYVRLIAEAFVKDLAPWSADDAFETQTGRRPDERERLGALFGARPTPDQRRAFLAWLERWAPRRVRTWRSALSDGGFIGQRWRIEFGKATTKKGNK